MKNLTFAIGILMSMILMSNKGYAQGNDQPKLMVVKFHADWCGSCKALGTTLEDLTNKLDGKSVLFTQLDFTNNTSRHQTKLLASALGIEKVVEANDGTGFLLVIDSKTKKVKATLKKDLSVKEMTNKINALL